jgi:GntR family transcriptional regulator, rspAB operon transcriptional repressor
VQGGATKAEPGAQAREAYERLLEAIVSLELRPGSYVSESELSSLIGVGRTPVREAVQRLSIEEFCDVLPRRGILIVPVDLDRQMDIQEMRALLEPAAARMAAERISDAEGEALSELLRQHQDADASDEAVIADIDETLHVSVAAASKNDLMTRTLAPLYAHSRRHWNTQKRRGLKDPEAIKEDWEAIVNAIVGRDSKAAERTMKAHVEAGSLALLGPSSR